VCYRVVVTPSRGVQCGYPATKVQLLELSAAHQSFHSPSPISLAGPRKPGRLCETSQVFRFDVSEACLSCVRSVLIS